MREGASLSGICATSQPLATPRGLRAGVTRIRAQGLMDQDVPGVDGHGQPLAQFVESDEQHAQAAFGVHLEVRE